MAFGVTCYLSAADRTANTNAISVSGAFTNPMDLGTLQIPASGNTLGAGVHIYCKNTGTTTIGTITADPTAAGVSGHADANGMVQVAPDASGSAGTWGADDAAVTVNSSNLAAGATFDFWVRADVPSTATPAGTTANAPYFEITLTCQDLG